MTATRIACLFLVLAAGRSLAADVLVATAIRGDVERAARALHVLDELQPGDELQLKADATAVVWWRRTNRRIAMTGPGRFRLDAGGVVALTSTGVSSVLAPTARADAANNRAAETMAGAILRSGDDARVDGASVLDLVAPSHAYVEWPAHPHVGAWTLRLRDTDGALLYEAAALDNRYVLPSSVPLQPGQGYTLEITWTSALRGEQVEIYPFVTLDRTADRRIAVLRRPMQAPLDERLTYARVLAEYGLNALALWICPEAIQQRSK